MNICTPSVYSKSTFANKIHAMITLPVYSTYAHLPKVSRVRRKPASPYAPKRYQQKLAGDYGLYINAV